MAIKRDTVSRRTNLMLIAEKSIGDAKLIGAMSNPRADKRALCLPKPYRTTSVQPETLKTSLVAGNS